MASRPWPVEELTVVGYADVLPGTKLPSIVPPLFQVNAVPGRFLVPPYHIDSGIVYGAAEVDEHELRQFDVRREVTLFEPGAIFPALTGHELWIDEAWRVRYEPGHLADENLRRIAEARLADAEQRLRDGDLAGADQAAAVAICADDRMLDPLAVMAAVARLRRHASTERLMVKLAQRHAQQHNFQTMVDRYVQGSNATKPMPPQRTGSPMKGMAACR